MIEETMLQAVRYDAACVCVNLFQIPGAPEVHAAVRGEHPQAQAAGRLLRHADDGGAARVPAERESRRLHGGRR